MNNPFDPERWAANVRFNHMVAALSTREQVIGTMADGSSIVTTVSVAVTR